MYSETFYKIGAILQFLAAVFIAYQGFGTSEILWKVVANSELVKGQILMIVIFLFSMNSVNLLISRSGMPIGLYKSFTLINIITWVLIFLITVFYFPLFYMILHGLILLAFIIAFFSKPKFQ